MRAWNLPLLTKAPAGLPLLTGVMAAGGWLTGTVGTCHSFIDFVTRLYSFDGFLGGFFFGLLFLLLLLFHTHALYKSVYFRELLLKPIDRMLTKIPKVIA